ncbi:MAG: recombinase family protein [Candidatus Nanohalobium sp.]
MKAALYARVSTQNQDLEPQEEKLREHAEQEDWNFDLYSEKASSIKERPEFEKIMQNIEDYDKVVVTKIDRFARSLQDFLERINKVRENGAEFQALDQPINTEDEMYGEFLLNQLALFADLERKMIRRRMEEGFEKAKQEGKVGRPSSLTESEKESIALKYSEKSYSSDISVAVSCSFNS